MNYKFILGDSLTKIDILLKNNEKFKLIITSPPYNIGKEYEKKINFDTYLSFQKKSD